MSLHNLSIGLGMVSWSPNLPYAHELTQLFDDISFELDTLITQELGQGSEDQDVSLPQKLSKSLSSLIRGHASHDMFHKMITKDQNADHVWWLVCLTP